MTELSTKNLDRANQVYWNEISEAYRSVTQITCRDFHYGPLVPGDSQLGLLPDVAGKRCLELACGAGENSIYLSRHGAETVALDVSDEQVAHGMRLAKEEGATVHFCQGSLDRIPEVELGTYDLVHSSFGLPFAADPATTVRHIAEDLLRPGGTLLFSAAHPASSGEWLELDGEGPGMFLCNYFDPVPDLRFADESDTMVFSRSYPVSHMVDWVLDAGLRLTAILEPEPMPVDAMSTEEIERHVPYYSDDWLALYEQLSRIPFLIILRATKPAQ